MNAPVPADAELLRSLPLPDHPDGGGKEERGRVLVVGGSRELPGAILLSGTAALRAGAGKLQIGTPASIGIPLGLRMPEAMVAALPDAPDGGIASEAAARIVELAGRCRAVLLGPGLTVGRDTSRLTRTVIEELDGPAIVLDAAAMMRIARDRDALVRQAGRLVVTPHAGELAGMLDLDKDAIEADPAEAARRAAGTLGVLVVLKGACTYIASPDGRLWSCTAGNPGLGTSGSGDVLAGLMCGLLARGADPVRAALWSVFVHGEAGDRLAGEVGPLGYLAREISGRFPAILAELSGPAAQAG